MTASHRPQLIIEFTDWTTAETTVTAELSPVLADHRDWWFIRKRPTWRLRLPTEPATWDAVVQRLDQLTDTGAIAAWRRTIYEPETHAFGGAEAMELAHDLFAHDSRHIIDHLRAPGRRPGRRELAVILAAALMQGAGLDWYEQGDVWARFAEQRPAPPDGDPVPATAALRASMRRLMTLDTRRLTGALTDHRDWINGFRTAGHALTGLAGQGRLTRGPRAILAHHLLFAYNRLGLPYNDQHHLSALATEVVMNHDPSTMSSEAGNRNLNPVQTMTEQTSDRAARLRRELTDRLRDQGTIGTDRIANAFATVARHTFVPDATPEQAYTDTTIFTKHSTTGEGISAISQPTVVALMLEQAQPQPGERVLELGAGTGYNAGLLSHLVGADGHVVTIDVDDDIVTAARTNLANAGCDNVEVLLGDGALGHPAAAPYDLIIATVGAHDLPTAWLEQLAPDGRLVVPLRLRGTVSRSLVLRRDANGRWRSTDDAMCTFMPLRGGVADDPRTTIALTPGDTVTLLTNNEQGIDAATLTGVLDQPRTEQWTGVHFVKGEPLEYMDLWLTCSLPTGLSRMPVTRDAVEDGTVSPEFPWGSQAVAEGLDLAYLTMRRDDSADTPRAEIGVVAHGPTGDELATKVVEQIRTWNHTYRTKTPGFEIQTTDQERPTPSEQTFVFDRDNTRLVITWQ